MNLLSVASVDFQIRFSDRSGLGLLVFIIVHITLHNMLRYCIANALSMSVSGEQTISYQYDQLVKELQRGVFFFTVATPR